MRFRMIPNIGADRLQVFQRQAGQSLGVHGVVLSWICSTWRGLALLYLSSQPMTFSRVIRQPAGVLAPGSSPLLSQRRTVAI